MAAQVVASRAVLSSTVSQSCHIDLRDKLEQETHSIRVIWLCPALRIDTVKRTEEPLTSVNIEC
jgi:hypothetical protein